MRAKKILFDVLAIVFWPTLACYCQAATILITPADSFSKIEAAQPGDEVLIAPGTYRFRLNLTKKASAESPIIIRALDPDNRPVWDLAGKTVGQWPGSYGGGDNNRGAWQIRGGAHYIISGIVIKNATNNRNSAGIRFVNANHITLRNCLMQLNDNGITGRGENILVEFCELDRNGQPGARAMTHNLYIYGGSWTLRHMYIHDSTHGQNFHVRARTCVIENSWIARARNYEGDIMTGPDPTHTMTLRGNVIIQHASPENRSKIFTLYNSPRKPGITMQLNLFYNTIIGNGGGSSLVQFSSADIQSGGATLSNNIIYGLTKSLSAVPGSKLSFDGTNNWFPTGAHVTGLENTVFGDDPGFRNREKKNYTLTQNADAKNAANTSATSFPPREYFQNETTTLRYRMRRSGNDLGAFETGTTAPEYSAGQGPLFSSNPNWDVNH